MTRPGDRKVLAISQEELIQRLKKVRGIQDENVLDAIRQVPREEFVPGDLIKYAYEDTALPIGEGQVITQPYLVALMTEVLELTEGDRVLEIGTGSGYAAAVISRIAEEVYTVERLPGLARAAGERFHRLGYDNIHVRVANGTLGWAEHAPYGAIMVSAGGPEIPGPLLEQLAVGGRLVIPIGSTRESQKLIRSRRLSENDYRYDELDPVRFVPLIGDEGWPAEDRERKP